MKIRRLDNRQIEAVYETYMRVDFPKDELKPLWIIMDMQAKGAYDCLGLFEDKRLLAYAYVVKGQKPDYLLLDYLAACAPFRNQGMGSRMMGMLREWYREKSGIFLECECLRTSVDEEQMKTRRRRQNFYLRNGCTATGVKSLVYGVEYDIFYVPLKNAGPEYDVQLDALYREMFPEKVRKSLVRIWNRNKSLRYVCRWSRAKRQYEEYRSLTEALGIDLSAVPQVISLTGAGGKTTAMYQLADELAEMGKRVMVTTTTHIARPRQGQILEVKHVSQVTETAWKTPILTVGRAEKQECGNTVQKLAAPQGLDDDGELNRLLEICDVILIEADGAACHPVKIPRGGEPVILPRTGLVIACAGLQGLDQTWKAGCFRFESSGAWMERSGEEKILPEDMARILSDERGTKKNVPRGACRYQILLNQADDREKMEQAEAVAAALPEKLQEGCVVTAYHPQTIKG